MRETFIWAEALINDVHGRPSSRAVQVGELGRHVFEAAPARENEANA